MNFTPDHEEDYKEDRLVYKMNDTGPQILRHILDKKGWIPFVEGETPYWNLSWKGSRYRLSEYENVQSSFQRLNHFPNTAIITRKDTLFRLLKKLRMVYGAVYDFFPLTLSLPKDYVKFVRIYAEEEEKGIHSTWICKPVDMSRGRGIFVFKHLSDLTYDCSAIVQYYIPNPMLISGYKFDLRCYVLVRSYNPLIIYVYEEGLTRFATSRYDMSDVKNVFSHLTNTSINKFSPTLEINKEEIGSGCRWKMARLASYFEKNGWDFSKLWKRIECIINLTLLPVAPEVTVHNEGCFELYGFDILIDHELKPWLLEVNLSPALNIDSQTDIEVKQPLLEELLTLINIQEDYGQMAQKHIEKQAMESKTRKKRGSMPSTYGGKPVHPLKSHLLPSCPNHVGGWKMIYPFDEYTKKQTEPNKIGQPNMKTIIANMKKHFL